MGSGLIIYLFTKQAILVLRIGLFHPRFSQSIYWRGMLNTVDFLVQSSLNRIHLVMITIYLFTKQAILVLHIELLHPRFSQSIYWRGRLL